MLNEEESKKISEPCELSKEEKDKHRTLLVGVAFFMILIVSLWVLNMKNVFKSSTAHEKKAFNIDEFSQEFKKSVNEAGARMSELKEITPDLLNNISTTTIDTAKK